MRRLSYSREICPYAGVTLATSFLCEPLAIGLLWRPVPSRAGGKLSALWTVFQVFHVVGLEIGSAPPKSLETGALHTRIYKIGAVRERNAR